MRLLVVDDEVKLAQYLHKGLTENGHVVDLVHDGIEGRRLAVGGDYDLVLLDLMLPGIDGFEVCRIRGLEQGADDYLVKPFAFSELLARVGALLRRGAPAGAQAATQLQLGDLELDLVSRKAQRAQQRLRAVVVHLGRRALVDGAGEVGLHLVGGLCADCAPSSTTPFRPSCCTPCAAWAMCWRNVREQRRANGAGAATA